MASDMQIQTHLRSTRASPTWSPSLFSSLTSITRWTNSSMLITNLDEHCAQAYMAGRKEEKLIEMKKIGSGGTVRHHQH